MSKILLRRRLSKMRLKMGTILMIMMQMMVRMMMRVMERVRTKARKMVMTMKVRRRRRRRRRRNKMEGGDMISEIVQKSVGSLWRKVSKDRDLLEGYCIKEWEQRSVGM
jgi:hypothetical protein